MQAVEKDAQIERPRGLRRQLETLREMDEGIIAFSEEDHKRTFEELKSKPDEYRRYIDYCTDMAQRHRGYANEHLVTARAWENHIEQQLSYLAHHLKENGLDCLKGSEHQIKLKQNPEKVVITADPDEISPAEFAEYLRFSREIDKTKVKEGIKSGDDKAMKLGRLERGYSVGFAPADQIERTKKGAKK